MPKGKASITGAIGWAPRDLPAQEFARQCSGLLRCNEHPEPSKKAIEVEAKTAMKAVRSYMAFTNTPMLTETKQKRTLNKISTAAARLNKALGNQQKHQDWANKLVAHLRKLDVNSASIVHRHLRRNGSNRGIRELKELLEALQFTDKSPDQLQSLLAVVAELSIWKDEGIKLRDPMFARLLMDLVPIWTKLTGCSPKTVDPATNEHPFAVWVDKLLEPARQYQIKYKRDPFPGVTRRRCEEYLSHIIFEKSGD